MKCTGCHTAGLHFAVDPKCPVHGLNTMKQKMRYQCPVCQREMDWEQAKKIEEYSFDPLLKFVIVVGYLLAIIIAGLWILT